MTTTEDGSHEVLTIQRLADGGYVVSGWCSEGVAGFGLIATSSLDEAMRFIQKKIRKTPSSLYGEAPWRAAGGVTWVD